MSKPTHTSVRTLQLEYWRTNWLIIIIFTSRVRPEEAMYGDSKGFVERTYFIKIFRPQHNPKNPSQK